VDSDNHLIGVISTRKLLLWDGQHKVADVMEKPPIFLKENQTLQDAMQLFSARGLLAFPVVDEDNHLLGIVDVGMYIEEKFDIADARHRSDVFQIIGLTLEEEKKSSVMRDYRLRMPWIFCNLVGGLICAIISQVHEKVLSKTIILAMFIPLVLTLSESVSMQAMTHSLHFLRRPKFRFIHLLKKAWMEWKTTSLMAVSSGIIVGIASLFWGDGIMPSITICFGIVFSVILSALFGISFPILLHKFRLDPKVASGPVVLMLADVLTTAFYLSLATRWLL